MSETNQVDSKKLESGLLALRLGVFIVMLMWTLDKFVNPGHSAAIFASFYSFEGVGPSLMSIFAALELVLLALFVSGSFKKWSYGAVLVLHGVSTLSAYNQYLDPFNNLLFFAAWPMLAACFALFQLRDYDRKMTTSFGNSAA